MLLRFAAFLVGSALVLATFAGAHRTSSFQAPATLIPKFPLTRGTLVAGASHPSRFVLRRRRPPLGGVRLRKPGARSLGVSPQDRGRFCAVVPAGGLPAGDPGAGHRHRHRSPARGDHLHLFPRGVHGASDHSCPDRRAGDRDAPRRPEHVAAQHRRVVSAQPATDVAGRVDDRERRVGRRGAGVRPWRRDRGGSPA